MLASYMSAFHAADPSWLNNNKRYAVIYFIDALLIALATLCAIRLVEAVETTGELLTGIQLTTAIGLMALSFAVCAFFDPSHRSFWRLMSGLQVVRLLRLVFVAWAVAVLILLTIWPTYLVMRIAFPELIAATCLLLSIRLIYRFTRERSSAKGLAASMPRPALLVGSIHASAAYLRALQGSGGQSLDVRGLITLGGDDAGRCLDGVPVVAELGDLLDGHGTGKNLARSGASTIIVTEPLSHAELVGLRRIAADQDWDVQFASSPDESLAPVAAGRLPLRTFATNTLLERPERHFPAGAVESMIQERRIVVTGAAGSIGSEIVRQVAACRPVRLILLDHSEAGLFQLERELKRNFPNLCYRLSTVDVRLRHALTAVFRAENPDIVFHAAALKHVPMVEANPCDGAFTNIIGTQNVINACRAVGVRAMVQVSTDKAVNPTGVMGASKRVAEYCCQVADLTADAGSTRYLTVRFGNVLGSSGSVVPIFKDQIARGGPVTVTHPAMTRFLMTIDEAVMLVLHAASATLRSDARRGMIHVLDMGEPVSIVALAERMIRLAGLEPYRHIDIAFTGLRPGEKLFEELFDTNETKLGELIDGVMSATSAIPPRKLLDACVERIALACMRGEVDAVRRELAILVPGYGSQTSVADQPRTLAA